MLRDLDAHDLDLIVHVGDIFWYPCSDARYRQTLDELNRLRHPVIYTPGDNEWSDCWEDMAGGFEPLERLASLRRIFFATPTQSLGGRRLSVVSQAAQAPFKEFVENVRWTHEGLVFATVHLPGSANAGESFPGRTAADDEAVKRRTTRRWRGCTTLSPRPVRAARLPSFSASTPTPGSKPRSMMSTRQNYEPFLTALEEEVEQFGKPVLVAQGDDHEFIVDRPLVRRTTGRRLDNFTRLQVPGSPDIGWVKVVVTPGPQTSFAFENRVVPMWKLW